MGLGEAVTLTTPVVIWLPAPGTRAASHKVICWSEIFTLDDVIYHRVDTKAMIDQVWSGRT